MNHSGLVSGNSASEFFDKPVNFSGQLNNLGGNANYHSRQQTFNVNPSQTVAQAQQQQDRQFELDEIKVTTNTLTHEISSMRKLIEDLHISSSEKDAEIIRLKMHLGDEKVKQRMRQTSQASLLNTSKDGSATKPTRLHDVLGDTPKAKAQSRDLSEV